MKKLGLFLLASSLLTGGLASPVRAAGRGEPGSVVPVQIFLPDRESDLQLLHDLDIDVDAVFGPSPTWARIYVLEEEIEKLAALGFTMAGLPDDPSVAQGVAPPEETVGSGDAEATAPPPAQYHTYATLTAELQQIASDHPSLVRLYSLGNSVQGRTLWMVKITDDPDVEEDEPEVRYIAAMHGDEVVGKEMCINLINLLTDSYGVDPRITSLVDTNEIWILPSMNPDGTEARRRYNTNGYDLNRNFPDQFDDPADSPAGRQLETQHVMNWGYAHSTDLSANYHGGALVANYPYDSTASGASLYSLAPDDALFVSLSRTYADQNPPMAASNGDPSFNDGVCNGSDWYAISGGMQDWNYVWRGGHELTLEISQIKWPTADTLPGFWNDNREAMLSFLERAREGVHGIVTDAITGAPLPASIRPAGMMGNGSTTHTDPDIGDYHRMLLPGRYDLEVTSAGYATRVLHDVVVGAGPAVRRDVALEPLDVNLQHTAERVVDGGNGQLEAGEVSDLAVTLRNLGLAASGVVATLEPAGWFAQIERAAASYPDLAAVTSGESLDPHHRVAIDPAAPAGHKVGFALRWTANEGSGVTEPFFLPVGVAECTTVASGDVPRFVPDRDPVTSTLSFSLDREISDLNVYLDIGHTYVGDLHVSLISPSGTPVALHSRTGGSSDDLVGWYDAARPPTEPLSRFGGEHAAGIWTLRVTDGVPSNTGTIRSWSVEACGRPFESFTPEVRLREVSKAPGAVALTWWPYPGITSYRVYRSVSPADPGSFVDVTAEDGDATDTRFEDDLAEPALFWLVSGVGPNGEGPHP